jgi:hypothetical protein
LGGRRCDRPVQELDDGIVGREARGENVAAIDADYCSHRRAASLKEGELLEDFFRGPDRYVVFCKSAEEGYECGKGGGEELSRCKGLVVREVTVLFVDEPIDGDAPGSSDCGLAVVAGRRPEAVEDFGGEGAWEVRRGKGRNGLFEGGTS